MQSLTSLEYGIALSLTRFLIEKDSKAYADFLNGVRSGASWEEALKKHYQWGTNEFVAAYGKSIGAPKLRP